MDDIGLDLATELIGRRFAVGRVDGGLTGAVLMLRPDGILSGDKSGGHQFWSIAMDKVVFRSAKNTITTIFDHIEQSPSGYLLRGYTTPRGSQADQTLTEIVRPREGPIAELNHHLYDDDNPLDYADASYRDSGYPHTNLIPRVVESVLDVVKPNFWFELGSMLGGSAIRVADAVKARRGSTQIVCVDPFTGDVNMWAWEQDQKRKKEWQFLRLEHGRPTIYDRFLANVVAAGHADIILPIAATSIVGIKLMHRLMWEKRLFASPDVIYLDSAHEPDETFLELQNCWNLLKPGGILMGDDWLWDAVRNDVLKFASTIEINQENRSSLAARHKHFAEHAGVLLDQGQWLLVK